MSPDAAEWPTGHVGEPLACVSSPAVLQPVVQRLLAARETLATRSPRQIAGVLSRVAAWWLEEGSPWMERAIAGLAEHGAFSRPMLAFGLSRMIAPLAGDGLAELVRRELGSWEAIDERRWPQVVLHVLPSNLPGHAAVPSCLTLLLRSAVLLKAGRDDRVFPPLWIESIGAVDAALGDCAASLYWPGAENAITDAALAQVDLVVASGSDAAVESFRRRCTGRFFGHGHRLSFAVVCRDSVDDATADLLAEDIAVWDQLGCLSPQVCFVEGDPPAALAFGEKVCAALARLAITLPPGQMSTAERLDVQRFRDAAEWRGFDRNARCLLVVSDEVGSGSVAIEDDSCFEPTPLHRCVRIVPVARAADAADVVAPHQRVLEAAGIAVGADRADGLRDRLRAIGLHHVVAVGDMQRPTLGWQPGGRPRIAEWRV
jgi:hypothetical protein